LSNSVSSEEELNQFQKLLYNSQPTGPQQMANVFSGGAIGANMQGFVWHKLVSGQKLLALFEIQILLLSLFYFHIF
jgi:hypothetical protein